MHTQATVREQHIGNIPALDGLRALAALAVVGLHAHVPGFENGGLGVDVFFVLSGFLITTILIPGAGARTSLRRFYRHRALRLLPAYFAVVAACVVANAFIHGDGTLETAAASSVYVANWAVGVGNVFQGGTLLHTWSLSVEEQFYLVWPLLLGLLLRHYAWSGTGVLRSVGALLAAAWLLAVALVAAGAPPRVGLSATPTRAFEILAGAGLAILLATPQHAERLERLTRRRLAPLGVIAGVLLLAAVPLANVSDNVKMVVGWPVISALSCVLVYACLRGSRPVTRLLGNRVLVAVGKRSYGLYLWHFPILLTIEIRWGLDTWQQKAIGLALAALATAASYRFIERPFLARKDQPFSYGPASGATPSGLVVPAKSVAG